MADSAVEEPRLPPGGSGLPWTLLETESQSLKVLFGLTNPARSDAVFVAVDFGSVDNIKSDISLNLNSEAGLAILDMRDLDSGIEPSKVITTYNFVSGGRDYQERRSKLFLFGDSIGITQNDMRATITSTIPTDRRIILVGHDIEHDLRCLDALSFDFSAFQMTRLDTQTIAAKALSRRPMSLKNLLSFFECPFAKLHCAGNDANFTLRALILLAIRKSAKTGKVGQPEIKMRLSVMEEIALSPLSSNQIAPDVTDSTRHCHTNTQQTRAAKRKAKRLEKSRRYQSKFWTHEMQESIRAERASKRRTAESITPLHNMFRKPSLDQ